jgi:adenosylmethionine-8-amino-7-oxononanoate aminotransferase
MKSEIFNTDKEYIWHPYTQEKNAENKVIVRGAGTKLFDEDGNEYIDAISSWWVNIHGHCNEYIASKLTEQAMTLEHVIFGGFTHPRAVQLARRLLAHLPENHKKIFYSDNGSTAVEIGLKMACQHWYNRGIEKNRVIALEGAYHGDTIGMMSIGEKSAFTRPFEQLLFETDFIEVPVEGREEQALKRLEEAAKSGDVIAFVFEPLIQGTAGMVMYSPEVLSEMIKICGENNVITVADEVAVGFGRTGRFFATDYLDEKPDIICMSKGITGGFMALGATSCTREIYEPFYDDDKMKCFFHGHSYTANPIACAAALASMDLMESDETWSRIKRVEQSHKKFIASVSEEFGDKVKTRYMGTVAAVEVLAGGETSYFNPIRDKAYNYFLERGVLLRPLGNVIYIFPPYVITEDELEKVYTVIREAIRKFT